MLIERDIPIPMRDGIDLRADVFRPEEDSPVPVVLTVGPYGKGVQYQESHKQAWEDLVEAFPEVLQDSNCAYMTWETVDPEKWVPDGYAVVRVDSRGMCRSPGFLDLHSELEAEDFYEAIEWAGSQPWSNGRVGLLGISYYAIAQWLTAALQPPHLAAMIPWEGASDNYRDISHHGGILSNSFVRGWFRASILPIQHGQGENGPRDPWLDDWAAGPETLSEEELAALRADHPSDQASHPFDDDYHRRRTPDFSRIITPLLSSGNWGGAGLHGRGNVEGYVQAGSAQKWLEIHPGHHEEWFYANYGMALQKRFFGHFLKLEANGFDLEPPVMLNIRHGDGSIEYRREDAWPLPRTEWTALYLDTAALTLGFAPPTTPATTTFEALGEPATFTLVIEEPIEITGPLAARLSISSTTEDADLFVTLRAFKPDGSEILFRAASEAAAPLTQGWLRASHRALDSTRSLPYRPWHPHDTKSPLTPGEVYVVDVEIWPTSIVLSEGYTLALTIGGRDFERPGREELPPSQRGSGPFLHNDPTDRPEAIFAGRTTLHTGSQATCELLIPRIPHTAT